MGIVIAFPLHKCRAPTRHFDEPAVVIEVDFEAETVARFGLPAGHSHS